MYRARRKKKGNKTRRAQFIVPLQKQEHSNSIREIQERWIPIFMGMTGNVGAYCIRPKKIAKITQRRIKIQKNKKGRMHCAATGIII